jgi:hydrogenase nickel incorporation protein HypA/HybF
MHELGIARNIVAIVDEAANGRRIRQVVLEIGQLSGVAPDAIRFCFDVVAQGSAADGAVLHINQLQGRARCAACGDEFETPSHLTACACGSRQLVRLQGEEINVRSIVLEEAA